jgi:hypothetical protein
MSCERRSVERRYEPKVLLAVLVLGVLIAIVAGAISFFVSLRATTAQEAQQLTGVGMMVPLILASFLLIAVMGNDDLRGMLGGVGAMDPRLVVGPVVAVITILDGALLVAADRRFRRWRFSRDTSPVPCPPTQLSLRARRRPGAPVPLGGAVGGPSGGQDQLDSLCRELCGHGLGIEQRLQGHPDADRLDDDRQVARGQRRRFACLGVLGREHSEGAMAPRPPAAGPSAVRLAIGRHATPDAEAWLDGIDHDEGYGAGAGKRQMGAAMPPGPSVNTVPSDEGLPPAATTMVLCVP